MGNLKKNLTLNNLKKTASQLAPFNAMALGTSLALNGASPSTGSSSSLNSYKPYSFNTPGFSGTVNGNTIDLTQNPELTSALTGVTNTANTTNNSLQGLIDRLGPGYNALTDAALKNLENARLKTVGNLQDNLARRRIAGSSFANDTLTRANAEFANQGEQIRAQNTLASLDAANKLIQEQHTNTINAFNTTIKELNLEGTTAAQVASGVSGIMSSNAQLQAQLNAQSEAGTGQLFGTIFGPALSAGASSALGSLFTTAAPAAATAAATYWFRRYYGLR